MCAPGTYGEKRAHGCVTDGGGNGLTKQKERQTTFRRLTPRGTQYVSPGKVPQVNQETCHSLTADWRRGTMKALVMPTRQRAETITARMRAIWRSGEVDCTSRIQPTSYSRCTYGLLRQVPDLLRAGKAGTAQTKSTSKSKVQPGRGDVRCVR